MTHLSEVVMGSLLVNNKFKILLPFILFILCAFTPSLILSAGYQEQKLFDGDFYSLEDLREKIEIHNREIQVLGEEIKALETDIDWMVLKINQIQDSSRTANTNLKKSITSKEKKVITLQKTKNRLEYLVQHYSAMLDKNKEQELENILRKKTSAYKIEKTPALKKKAKINVEETAPKTPVPMSQPVSSSITENPDQYDSISPIQLQTAINQAGLSDWVEIIGTGTCLRIETTLPILFSTGSAKVAHEYTSFFKKLADFLKPYDVKVLVNGYADTVPIQNKKYPSNFELGATRAANIVHQLISYGLKPSIFKIESAGEYRFAAKGLSKQKSFERRAEVTVIFSG